jgi:mono/diheme cytochrome c family protein
VKAGLQRRAAGWCLGLLPWFVPSIRAQSTPPEAKTGRVYAELARAPEKARKRENPLASDRDAVAAGRLLFEDHCAECHGDTAEGGKGRKRGPSLRAPEVQNAAPGALFWLLTNGVVRKGMPVWSKLPEPERWQVVSYLKSLGTSEGPAAGGETPPRPD